jgi:DNA-binding response OmpR family regulator
MKNELQTYDCSDDPVIQEELSVLLKSNGYEVILPKDFFNIISEIQKSPPHLPHNSLEL